MWKPATGDVAAGEDAVMEKKYALCFTSRDYDEKVLSTLSLKAARSRGGV